MPEISWEFATPGAAYLEGLGATLYSVGLSIGTTTHFSIFKGGFELAFDGAFTVNGFSQVTGGKISGFHLYQGETLLLDASGYAMDFGDFRAALDAITAGDGEPVTELFLGADMTEKGTDGLDHLFSGRGGDHLSGYGGIDFFQSGDGNDVISGGDGGDQLVAENGRDILKGGTGNDGLFGGRGNDRMVGGDGADQFHFDFAPSAGGVDKITDFEVGSDLIHLRQNAFDRVGDIGELDVARFHIGAKAHDGSDRVIYNDKTGALYYDADGQGGEAQVKFATLDTGLKLSNADFMVLA